MGMVRVRESLIQITQKEDSIYLLTLCQLKAE